MKRIAYFLLLVLFVLQACSPKPKTKSSNSHAQQGLIPPVASNASSNSSLPGAAGAGRTNPTATPSTPSGTLCAGADNVDTAAFAAEVIRLVNVERAKVGAAPVTAQSQLTQAAQRHAIDMGCNGLLSHTGTDGTSPFDRIDQSGYQWSTAGENVAAGFATPAEVMTAWMNSDVHRANILEPGYTEIGIGYIHDPATTYEWYWVMDLGTPF